MLFPGNGIHRFDHHGEYVWVGLLIDDKQLFTNNQYRSYRGRARGFYEYHIAHGNRSRENGPDLFHRFSIYAGGGRGTQLPCPLPHVRQRLLSPVHCGGPECKWVDDRRSLGPWNRQDKRRRLVRLPMAELELGEDSWRRTSDRRVAPRVCVGDHPSWDDVLLEWEHFCTGPRQWVRDVDWRRSQRVRVAVRRPLDHRMRRFRHL